MLESGTEIHKETQMAKLSALSGVRKIARPKISWRAVILTDGEEVYFFDGEQFGDEVALVPATKGWKLKSWYESATMIAEVDAANIQVIEVDGSYEDAVAKLTA